jgi:ATP-dependent Clp protease adaptor protein ClpS
MRLPPSLSSFWWWAVEINRCNPTKKPSFPLGKGRFLFGATELMVNGACGVPLSYFSFMQIYMAQDDDDKNGGRPGVGLATRTRPKTKKPSLYKVLLLNDDYTPMEFVVHVLKAFFQMDTDQATRVMIHVHQKGVGVCGIFTYEVAETKVTQVMDFALKNQHPLQCTLEKD